ncbi:MAG: hypothetical protein ACRDYB_00155 [Acidimicrobiales bacterium]
MAVVGCSLALCACDSAPAAAPPTTRDKPTASTSAPVATTNSVPAAVLQGYRASWAAFEQALSTADASDRELAATMVDPQLTGVKANLAADQLQGIVGRGATTLHPKITALSGTTATVVDCAYSSSELVYAKTGQPVPPVTPPENDGIQATLVLAGGSWKVSKQTVTDGKCAPGS